MSRVLSAADRARIRQVYSLPAGSPERKALVARFRTSALSWKREPIEIAVGWEGNTQTVPAQVAGVWAIHKAVGRGRGWSITHVPSKKSIGKMSSGKKARLAVEAFVEAEPALLNAQSDSEVRRHADLITPIITGILPFESIMRAAGLRNLGERYGKRGDHWGIEGGSMMIRVGGRDLVLTSWSVYGEGARGLTGTWGMRDAEYQSKVTRAQLDNWIAQVKAAPTMQQLRDDWRNS